MSMKTAVMSDIHGNSAALSAVLADIRRRGIKTVINLGDCFSGPLDATETARILQEENLPTVSGNHDRLLWDSAVNEMGPWERWVIDDLSQETLDWVRTLPKSLVIGDLFCCHATPHDDETNWLDRRGPSHRVIARDLEKVESYADGIVQPVMLCGHTHTPRAVRLPDGRRIINPGSVGCPAYLDNRMEPNFIHQTGAPDARYAVIEKVDDDWISDLIAVPYDASEMIERARENGAKSWAHALLTGWWA